MSPDLQEKLFLKYPDIFQQKDMSMMQTCMCWGIECNDGWYDLINQLCHEIKLHIDFNLGKDEKKDLVQVQATQVKEKYGTLRFYHTGGNKFIDGLVWMAEGMSRHLCEICGSPGFLREGSWVTTRCDGCHDNK